VAIFSAENLQLKATVTALRSMIEHEKQMKHEVDAAIEELCRKCVRIDAEMQDAKHVSAKAWRTNIKKMKNYGPLAPSSIMDPFAEEQRIMREREKQSAEKGQQRKMKAVLAQKTSGVATGPVSSATVLHSFS
jgi:hypothetical protein